MKSATLLFSFCIVTFYVIGQQQTIPKGVDKIQVRTWGNQDWSFNKTVNSLTDQGYEIEKAEREFGIIKTAQREVKGLNANYYLYIVVRDSVVNITGQFIVNVAIGFGAGVSSTPSWSKIQNSGMKGSPARQSFEHMNEFAVAINDREMQYLKQ
jgi:hypothetical protein